MVVAVGCCRAKDDNDDDNGGVIVVVLGLGYRRLCASAAPNLSFNSAMDSSPTEMRSRLGGTL